MQIADIVSRVGLISAEIVLEIGICKGKKIGACTCLV